MEETARIFSERWKKDVNRTHIARIKNSVKLSNQGVEFGDDNNYNPVGHHSHSYDMMNPTSLHHQPHAQATAALQANPGDSLARFGSSGAGLLGGGPRVPQHQLTHQRHQHINRENVKNELLSRFMMNNPQYPFGMSIGQNNNFKALLPFSHASAYPDSPSMAQAMANHYRQMASVRPFNAQAQASAPPTLPVLPNQLLGSVHHVGASERHHLAEVSHRNSMGRISQAATHPRETESPRSLSNNDSVISRSPISVSPGVIHSANGYVSPVRDNTSPMIEARQAEQVNRRVPVICSLAQAKHCATSVIKSNPSVIKFNSNDSGNASVDDGGSTNSSLVACSRKTPVIVKSEIIGDDVDTAVAMDTSVENDQDATIDVSSVEEPNETFTVNPPESPDSSENDLSEAEQVDAVNNNSEEGNSESDSKRIPFRCPQCPTSFEDAQRFWLHLREDHNDMFAKPTTSPPTTPVSSMTEAFAPMN